MKKVKLILIFIPILLSSCSYQRIADKWIMANNINNVLYKPVNDGDANKFVVYSKFGDLNVYNLVNKQNNTLYSCSGGLISFYSSPFEILFADVIQHSDYDKEVSVFKVHLPDFKLSKIIEGRLEYFDKDVARIRDSKGDIYEINCDIRSVKHILSVVEFKRQNGIKSENVIAHLGGYEGGEYADFDLLVYKIDLVVYKEVHVYDAYSGYKFSLKNVDVSRLAGDGLTVFVTCEKDHFVKLLYLDTLNDTWEEIDKGEDVELYKYIPKGLRL